MALIRPFEQKDWPGVWRMLEPVFLAGETYAVPTDLSEDGAYRFWVQAPEVTFVALDDNGEPASIPPVQPETDEQQRRFENAEIRRQGRLDMRKELQSGES